MSTYAKVNPDTNLVERVIVADQRFIDTLDDASSWKLCEDAGQGWMYDPILKKFKKYPSWNYDSSLNKWVPPVSYPEDGEDNFDDGSGVPYAWNEETKRWDQIVTDDSIEEAYQAFLALEHEPEFESDGKVRQLPPIETFQFVWKQPESHIVDGNS